MVTKCFGTKKMSYFTRRYGYNYESSYLSVLRTSSPIYTNRLLQVSKIVGSQGSKVSKIVVVHNITVFLTFSLCFAHTTFSH